MELSIFQEGNVRPIRTNDMKERKKKQEFTFNNFILKKITPDLQILCFFTFPGKITICLAQG